MVAQNQERKGLHHGSHTAGHVMLCTAVEDTAAAEAHQHDKEEVCDPCRPGVAEEGAKGEEQRQQQEGPKRLLRALRN